MTARSRPIEKNLEHTIAYPILVTGGTGALGSALVPRLLAQGQTVRILSRTARPNIAGIEYVVGDLQTGAGVDAAVTGLEIIVHGAGSAKGDAAKAETLVGALQRAGVARHLLYMSVVGADTTPVVSTVDRSTLGYFEAKRMAELSVAGSASPSPRCARRSSTASSSPLLNWG